MLGTRDESAGLASGRAAFVDGLRGCAILAVILYHAYSRHTEIIPTVTAYGEFLLFEYGWAGVHLFFLISGYVMLMTLRRSRGFAAFLGARWRRLFPAMLVVSLFIYASAGLFPERPAGEARLSQLIPGLLFIHRGYIEALTGSAPGVLEGSYWSIYVEVHFYIVIGALFFLMGEKRALIAFACVASIPTVLALANLHKLMALAKISGLVYFPWFLMGALLFRYANDRRTLAPLTAAALALIYVSGIYMPGARADYAVMTTAVAVVFISPFLLPLLRPLFAAWPLRFIGFISYPLYLIHENLMIAMIVKLARVAPSLPPILLPLPPIAFIMAVAFIVAKYVEPWVRGAIDHAVASVRARKTGDKPLKKTRNTTATPGSTS